MIEICAGLIKKKFSSSWIDIYNYRLNHVGDDKQAVKSITDLQTKMGKRFSENSVFSDSFVNANTFF